MSTALGPAALADWGRFLFQRFHFGAGHVIISVCVCGVVVVIALLLLATLGSSVFEPNLKETPKTNIRNHSFFRESFFNFYLIFQ